MQVGCLGCFERGGCAGPEWFAGHFGECLPSSTRKMMEMWDLSAGAVDAYQCEL